MVSKIVYLDIETTKNCVDWMRGEADSRYKVVKEWEILTVQWQEVDAFTGQEIGELKMIKRWDVDSELDFMKGVCSLSGELRVDYSFSYYDNREGKDKEVNNSVNNFLFSENPPKLGHNLKFEQQALEGKIEQFGGFLRNVNKPMITYGWNVDMMPFGILRSGPSVDSMGKSFEKKGGQTRGSSLHNISCKETSGKVIEKMYEEKDWDGIEDYIRKETKCAIETYRQLLDHMKDWKYVEK